MEQKRPSSSSVHGARFPARRISASQHIWFRAWTGCHGRGLTAAACLLSDSLVDTALNRHGISDFSQLVIASVTMRCGFIAGVRVDDWLLYICGQPQCLGSARFTPAAYLHATDGCRDAAQEG